MQSVVRSTSVLETREIRHPAALSKPVFLRDWKDPKILKQITGKFKHRHEAGRHKMGKHWHHVMGPKRGGGLFRKRLWNKVQPLGDGFNIMHLECVLQMWISKMLISASLRPLMKFSQKNVEEDESKEYFLCLGHSTWACLMWPLSRVTAGEENFSSWCPLNLHVGSISADHWSGMSFRLSLLLAMSSYVSNKLEKNVLSLAFTSCMKRFLAAKMFFLIPKKS